MKLKNEVVKDSDKFVPMRAGMLKNSAIESVSSNSDQIVYKTPYARFLYYGKVMVGRTSGKAWASNGETKVVTNKDLTYSRPTACAFWFERAKSLYKKNWLELVKKVYK